MTGTAGPQSLPPEARRGSAAPWEIRLLGPIEIHNGVRALGLGGKERRILALLALQRPRRVAEDDLIDALWGDAPPRTARRTLHGYVCRLRRSLRFASCLEIETVNSGYRLVGPPLTTDLDAVDALQREAGVSLERGDPHRAARLLAHAENRWRGHSLGDDGEALMLAPDASRLEELRLSIVERRCDAELRAGRHQALTPELEALTMAHPLRERLWEFRMTALYRSGRQGDALGAYQELRAHLIAELGIDPSPALRALEGAVLRQDAALDWTPLFAVPNPPARIGRLLAQPSPGPPVCA